MNATKRHVATAERIIQTNGLAFALACAVVGKSKTGDADLAEARRLLAEAIVRALADEYAHGETRGAQQSGGMSWEEATS